MAHLRPILAIARKDALDIWLDKTKLGVMLSPVVLTLLYALLSHLLGSHPTTILVYNPGQSKLEQVVSSAFATATVTPANAPADVSAAFPAGSTDKNAPYDVGLVIPAGFEQSLQAGEHPVVNLYLNEQNMTPVQSALLQAAITNYARTVAAPDPPLRLSTATINAVATNRQALTLSGLYGVLVIPLSFVVGLTLMPGLLIEEKERKTLRMLMVSPASFADVVLGKLLIVWVCQIALTTLLLVIMGGFVGNIPLLLLYLLLGAGLAIAVGLLLGGLLQTAGAAGGLEGMLVFAFIIPSIFIPLAPMLGSSPITQIIRVLPTYYFGEGAFDAAQNLGSVGSNLLDVSVLVVSIVVVLLLAVWMLRRQAAVAAVI